MAYITAVGALFPFAVNDLVVGLKAAELWDSHIGSIKLAVGVPDLAASLIDLRNPSFNGTAVNSPTHSPTHGWSFTKASSQYIDSAWRVVATGSKASLNSVHVGLRLMAATVDGGSALTKIYSNPNALGFGYLFNGFVNWAANDVDSSPLSNNPAIVAGSGWIGTRTASNARSTYRAGVVNSSDSVTSNGTVSVNQFIGARNNNGTPDSFGTSRITAWHAGAGLDDMQAAVLDALLSAYAAACGET